MKPTFKTALKTVAVAAALVYAGASQAAYTYTAKSGGNFRLPEGSQSFNVAGTTTTTNTGTVAKVVNVAVYDLADGANSYFAFCIDPVTEVTTGAQYTAKSVTVSDDVKRLYEHYFTGNTMTTTQRAAFQLALWELTNDDGNLYAMPTTGFAPKQYFNTTADAKVSAAAGMLSYALDQSNALTNKYNYIEFDSQGSQSLLSVSAVPEADTWAMMGVGLGLIGLMGRRRKSAQTEKFA